MYLCLFFHTEGRLSGLNLNCNTIYMIEIQFGSQPFRKVSRSRLKHATSAYMSVISDSCIYCHKIYCSHNTTLRNKILIFLFPPPPFLLIFIFAPCVLIYVKFTHQQIHFY